MVVGSGSGVVVEGARRALDGLDACVSAATSSATASGGSREDWAGVVGDRQRVIDVAAAAQDAAIVRLACIEAEFCEDGTVVESHRAAGHVALDAPAIISGVLNVSSVQAERRVRSAVWLAAGGPGAARESGLGGLHAAMAAGRLDSYRASVVARSWRRRPRRSRRAWSLRSTRSSTERTHPGCDAGAAGCWPG